MPKSTGRKKKQREADQQGRAGNGGQEIQGGRNVGEIERVISSVLGGTLLIGGLSRRSLSGLALAATGAAFLYRGATGYCKIYESLGLDTFRNAGNADRFMDRSHEMAHIENSLEERLPSSKSRRKQTTKPMTDKKGIGKAATVSGSPNMMDACGGIMSVVARSHDRTEESMERTVPFMPMVERCWILKLSGVCCPQSHPAL